MIQPTVGRKVWFYPSIAHALDEACQPQDATIVFVISDRLINVRVSDHKGDQTPKLAVQLYQEGDTDPTTEFCCWMPYQSEQAKKHAAPPAGTQVDQKHYNEVVTQVGELTSRVAKLESHLVEHHTQKQPSESSSKDTPVQPPAGDSPAKAQSQASPPAKQVTK